MGLTARCLRRLHSRALTASQVEGSSYVVALPFSTLSVARDYRWPVVALGLCRPNTYEAVGA